MTMQRTLDSHWMRGQQFEAQRDLESARAEYEALLALNAAHVPARLRMSRFEQMEGRYRNSRQHALAAADAVRVGGSVRHVGFVTQRLLEFSEEAEVASVILSSDWADPRVVSKAPMLAQHLTLAGRYEDALRFIDTVSTGIPANALLSLTRGNVLRYLGQLEAAAADYQASLALMPDLADAHWALSTLMRAESAYARTARIGNALRNSPMCSIERAHLCYALFRELDAAGDVDAAWSSLAEGAAIMHKLGKQHRVPADRGLRSLLRMAWSRHPCLAAEQQQPSPIFIVGLPRTGTTLLDRILGNHGWVSPVGERNDFSAAVSLVSDRFFSTLDAVHDPAAFLDIDHAAVGHEYLQRLRRASSATAFAVDKNPQNLSNLPLILRALPQARVLCLQREPMDAAFSNLKELFQGGSYAYSYSFEGLAREVQSAGEWMQYWARMAPGSVRLVSYEALVADPESVVDSILDFIGLPAQKGLHEITQNLAPTSTASSAQIREAIHARSVGAWKRYAMHLEPLRAMLQPGK